MPLIRKYSHLFFDLDNTLWDFDLNARLALRQATSMLGLNEQIEDFDSFFNYFDRTNAGLWDAYRRKEIRHRELVVKRFEIVIGHFGLSGIKPSDFNELYLRLMPTFTSLVDGAVETLAYLQQEGYQLHIITNGIREVQHYKIKNSGLAPYFSKITVSEDINVPKPDKRIFRQALMTCNAKKSKSMMIGDTWETDIVGAKEIGMDYIHFCKNQKNLNIPHKYGHAHLEKPLFFNSPPSKNDLSIKSLFTLQTFL
ncbi:MAG: YjjG family noncanonical pyrimidine nucleotidase [Prolixibacteraceae bacterium]